MCHREPVKVKLTCITEVGYHGMSFRCHSYNYGLVHWNREETRRDNGAIRYF